MAAPAPTARATPGGIALRDGHSTLLTCALDDDIEFWEKEVQPIGFDGGDAVDTTTMHNTTVRTKASRTLIDVTEATTNAAYDPGVLDSILAILNVETTWTITFPDGSTWAFFGYLRVANPQSVAEGAQPEIAINIQPTNTDPANGWVEAVPFLTNVAGT